MLKSIKSYSPIVKALSLVGLIVAIATSATFALTSPTASAYLTGGSLQTASASIKLSTDNVVYDAEIPSASVAKIVPGKFSSSQTLYFKNDGEVEVFLNLQLNTISPPVLNNINSPADVLLRITGVGCAEPPMIVNLDTISSQSKYLPCSRLNMGVTGRKYLLSYSLNPGSIVNANQPASVSNINLKFNGSLSSPVTVLE